MSKHRIVFIGPVGPQRLNEICIGKLLARQSNAKMSKPMTTITKNDNIYTYFDFEFPHDLTKAEFAEWVAESMKQDFNNARFVVMVDDLDGAIEVKDIADDPPAPIEIRPPGLFR